MASLFRFSQNDLLALHPSLPADARGGVCAGVCDYWLSRITRAPDEEPAARLAALMAEGPAIVKHYLAYETFKLRHGRETAKKQFGNHVGLDYDTDKTVVTAEHADLSGITRRITMDIAAIGSGANWTIVFSRGRHALAGFCGMQGRQPIFEQRIHIFDPNVGERVCTRDELHDAIFATLKPYQGVTEMHRIDVRRP